MGCRACRAICVPIITVYPISDHFRFKPGINKTLPDIYAVSFNRNNVLIY